MPLFLLVGHPSSGKSYRSAQLSAYLHERIVALPSSSPVKNLSVVTINDHMLSIPRSAYGDAKEEKEARGAMFAAIQRALGRDRCVIVEGNGSFIKGWRYQVWCEGKAAAVPGCVVHVGTPISTCRAINTRLLEGEGGYEPAILEDLIGRFEEPEGRNRWDSPLFTVPYEDERMPLEAMWDAMIGEDGKGTGRVKQHAATVLAPAAESDYLYELDKTTQDVLGAILAWRNDHPGEGGGEVAIAGEGNAEPCVVRLPASGLVALPQLQRMRRAFLALNRGRQIEQGRIRGAFVEYLNDGLG